MALVEINSPLTGTVVPNSFTVSGWSDLPAGTAITVSGAAVAATVAADGTWSTTANFPGVGTFEQDVVASGPGMPAPSDQVTVTVGVRNLDINPPMGPLPFAAMPAGTVSVAAPVDGTITDPNVYMIIVELFIFKGPQKFKVVSAGLASYSSGGVGKWSIYLPFPATAGRQVVVVTSFDIKNNVLNRVSRVWK